MGIANRRNYNHLWAYHRLQALHLARLGDTSLYEGNALTSIEHQQRQSHTELRVITLGRRKRVYGIGHRASRPLLDYGLAIRACNSHYHTLELLAVVGRKPLQSY